MKDLMTTISKDLFVNKDGNENPFTMAEERFYVRVLAVKRGWVAYSLVDGKTSYMKIENFRNNFCYPDLLYGSVCAKFANKYAAIRLLTNKVIDNPNKGKIPLEDVEDYTATELVHKVHKPIMKKINNI